MSMQVNVPFIIELIFRGTNKTIKINSFDPIEMLVFKNRIYTTMTHEYGKPVGFKLIGLNVPTDSTKLINWLQQEFKFMFSYDPLLWLASVATLPVELHQYLIPFHKDLHDITIS